MRRRAKALFVCQSVMSAQCIDMQHLCFPDGLLPICFFGPSRPTRWDVQESVPCSHHHLPDSLHGFRSFGGRRTRSHGCRDFGGRLYGILDGCANTCKCAFSSSAIEARALAAVLFQIAFVQVLQVRMNRYRFTLPIFLQAVDHFAHKTPLPLHLVDAFAGLKHVGNLLLLLRGG